MKDSHDPLDRLFKAAAQAPREAAVSPPFGLETRVMANWRASQVGDDSALMVVWLRRAVALASVLVLASALWSYNSPTRSDDFSLADSAMQIALNQ